MKIYEPARRIGYGFWALMLTGLLFGLLLILLPVEFLIKVFFIVIGVMVLISSVSGIASGLRYFDRAAGKISLALSLISAVFGLVLIFWHSSLLSVLVGVYLIALPIVQILLSGNRRAALRSELPRLIVGTVLLLIGPAKALEVMFDVAGWVTVALTVLLGVAFLVARVRRTATAENRTGNRVFVDTTGDGSIDTVYVDTDGDGKHDTAKRYRDGQ